MLYEVITIYIIAKRFGLAPFSFTVNSGFEYIGIFLTCNFTYFIAVSTFARRCKQYHFIVTTSISRRIIALFWVKIVHILNFVASRVCYPFLSQVAGFFSVYCSRITSYNVCYTKLLRLSYEKFEEHHIDFIEKLSENIASVIASVNVNLKTASLLEQSLV